MALCYARSIYIGPLHIDYYWKKLYGRVERTGTPPTQFFPKLTSPKIRGYGSLCSFPSHLANLEGISQNNPISVLLCSYKSLHDPLDFLIAYERRHIFRGRDNDCLDGLKKTSHKHLLALVQM